METSEKSADKLVKTAEEQIKECFKVLPRHGEYILLKQVASSAKIGAMLKF